MYMITSQKGQQMIKKITPMYSNSEIEQAIYQAIGSEWDDANKLVDEILVQLFPQTATWGLTFWEERLNLITNLSEDIEKRRGKIMAKLQSKHVINPERMAIIIKNFVGIDVLVSENVADYIFRLDINGELDFRLQQLRKIVSKIKPSHLSYLIRYILEYINKYLISLNSIIETKISYSSSVFNIPGTLLLNGKVNLNGEYFLSESIIPDGIKKYFCFITEKIFRYLYKYKCINKINTTLDFNNFNSSNNEVIVNTLVSFYNSIYNIPTHLNLGGLYELDGLCFFNKSIRSSGIKKCFNSNINIILKNKVSANNLEKIKTILTTENSIRKDNVCSGGVYKFKALNNKQELDGQIDLSNKTSLMRNI